MALVLRSTAWGVPSRATRKVLPMCPSILVVDDEPTIREILAAVLADEGYRVRTARDGQEALALLDGPDGAAADLILSDVMMPRMTGVELVGRLRARGDSVPVVLMSANHAGDDLPGVRFLAKPFDLDDVSAAVRRALGDGTPCP
jgi:CheY-like chemotaxis protein